MASRRGRVLPVVGVAAAVLTLVGIRLAQPPGGTELRTSAPASATGREPTPPLPDEDVAVPPSAVDGLRFVDVSEAAGLTDPHSSRPLTGAEGMTAGAAVADVDGDGDMDLYLTRVGRPNALYVNQGDGTFVDEASTSGAGGPDPEDGSAAAAFADLDGDGDQDLLLTPHGRGRPSLHLNDGAGRFTEATGHGFDLPAPDPRFTSHTHGLAVADVDGDGLLDVVVTHWDESAIGEGAVEALGGPAAIARRYDEDPDGGACARMAELRATGAPRDADAGANRSRLFLNEGAARFRDATAEYGLDLERSFAFTPEFADFDGDGRPDLFVTGDTCTSRLFRNVEGSRFEDVTAAAGVGTDENGMGSVVRDLDGDGVLDWFVSSIGYPTRDGSCPIRGGLARCSGNRLYLGRGDGTFADATDRLGLRHGWWGWGAAIEDFGNDGVLRVVQTNGMEEPVATDPARSGTPEAVFYESFLEDPTRFWTPVEGTFVDVARRVGITHRGQGRALVAFDADGDGRRDVLITNTNGPPVLYRNESDPGRGWLTVRLDDPSSPNRQGIGAVVTVTVEPGRAPVVGTIGTSGSYESQKPPELHVGLGDLHRVHSVSVRWPGSDSEQVLSDVAADRVLTVTRAG